MLSLLSDEQRRERLYASIGVLGSCVAMASFFLLPVGVAGVGGHLSPVNGWEFLRVILSAFTPASIIGLLIVLLFPGCSSITLVIGGTGLFRPVPRHAVQMFTLAMLPGLVLLVFLFFASFASIQSLWGYWGMCAGYLGILVGRSAFAQEGA